MSSGQSKADSDFFRLTPHEDDHTDVILLGHSIGGILAAEVALYPAAESQRRSYRHHIVGVISFDTPFLGLHPRIVSSGIASLFRPKSKAQSSEVSQNQQPPGFLSPEQLKYGNGMTSGTFLQSISSQPSLTTLQSSSSLALSQSSSIDLQPDDPNFNPPYTNDVRRPQRKALESALHFINKHSDHIVKATIHRLDTQLQFASCVTEHTSLNNRYSALKSLNNARLHDGIRLRFVNYYTASTGWPKEAKSPKSQKSSRSPSIEPKEPLVLPDAGRRVSKEGSVNLAFPEDDLRPAMGSPRISIEHADGQTKMDVQASPDLESLEIEDRVPATDSKVLEHGQDDSNEAVVLSPEDREGDTHRSTKLSSKGDQSPHDDEDGAIAAPQKVGRECEEDDLASIPPVPEPPLAFDPQAYPDNDTRKIKEKEYNSQLKAYEKAVKEREKAVNRREKQAQKQEAAVQKELKKSSAIEAKERAKAEAEADKEAKRNAKAEAEAVKKEAKLQAQKEKAQKQKDEQDSKLDSANGK